MTSDLDTLRGVLDALPCSACTYQEWVNVGMALKEAGADVSEWDFWSAADAGRYRRGECGRKWKGFGSSSAPHVKAGSIVLLAREKGYAPSLSDASNDPLTWDSTIGTDKEPAVALPHLDLPPAEMLVRYLQTLFRDDEHVGYVTEVYRKPGDNTPFPKKGSWSDTAGRLVKRIRESGSLNEAVGDWPEDAGAWIRFNPLDGQGVSDSNVTAYRFALVESDKTSPEETYRLVRELNLPVAALVHSGGKSLHAIVRVDAGSREEYRERVALLFETCKKHGLEVDTNNKNPSRLSRLPGVTRNGNLQALLATNIGAPSWAAWREEQEENDYDLPPIVSLEDFFANPPAPLPFLIDGLLPANSKMALTGPSKAGKSFAMLELCLAFASGGEWIHPAWKCRQCHCLYLNLEIQPRYLYERLEAFKANGLVPPGASKFIHLWNLRGRQSSIDAIAKPLVKEVLRLRSRGISIDCILIDPTYKVFDGDENKAQDVSHFCNALDRILLATDATVVYAHHHSKGPQAGRSAQDRGSGSGVFARDCDAIVDLSQLDLSTCVVTNQEQARADALAMALAKAGHSADSKSPEDLLKLAEKAFGITEAHKINDDACRAAANWTGWIFSSRARNAPDTPTFRCWFKDGRHVLAKDELDDMPLLFETGPVKRKTSKGGSGGGKHRSDLTAQRTVEIRRIFEQKAAGSSRLEKTELFKALGPPLFPYYAAKARALQDAGFIEDGKFVSMPPEDQF